MKYKRKDVRKIYVLRYIEDGVGFKQEFRHKDIMNEFIEKNEIDLTDIADCFVTETYFLKITRD